MRRGSIFKGFSQPPNGTHFCITTRNLTDKKKPNVSTTELKAVASSHLANEKKADNVVHNFKPQSFSDILANFIEGRHVEAFPEAKKKLLSKWNECNAVSLQSVESQSSESNDDEEEDKDLFESQAEIVDANKEDMIESILTDIDQLSAMDSWCIGHAECDVVDRLIKLCKKLESNIKDLIQGEKL